MGRLFLWWVLSGLLISLILFFPIVIQSSLHYDLNDNKAGFSVRLFKILPVFGGYVQTYQSGLALHITKKKAILIPYSQLDSERKRFSFIQTFRLIAFTLTTETGAEYLLPVSFIQVALRIPFFVTGGKRENVENNLWLTDGDTLRVSLHSAVYFNIFILLRNFIVFLKEKLTILWQKKNKNSAI